MELASTKGDWGLLKVLIISSQDCQPGERKESAQDLLSALAKASQGQA